MDRKHITVLLVDDEKKFLDSMSERIRLRGFEPVSASTGEEAIEVARRAHIDIAIVDYRMPGMDGVSTITKLKEIHPSIRTVLLTGFGNEKVKEAAEAVDAAYFEKDEMRSFWNFIKQFGSKSGMIIIQPPAGAADTTAGAGDRNPGTEQGGFAPEELEIRAAGQALERRLSFGEMEKPQLFFEPRLRKIVGESASMLELKENVRKVASLDCTVLILGETGTGKELVARAIHTLSPRRDKKFTAVDCGSFSEELLENELFGHEKEAFSGAVQRKRGVFETASGGTMLLGEIGDTPLSLQLKLLRVLQERTVVRQGGTDEIPVDVRVLAATNQSLEKKMDKGEFRGDLYCRLNTFILRVPPLRERRDDIPLLSSYFLDTYRREFGKEITRISEEVHSLFLNYPFPGNVRELEGAIERGVIVCEGNELKKEHLPRRFTEIQQPADKEKKELVTLAELEERYILEVVQATKGNKSEAARILGINRASLWRKLKQIEEKKRTSGVA